MKLRTCTQRAGICYQTARRWWKAGKLKGYQMETGTVSITEVMNEQPGGQERFVVVSTRVSANENRPHLDSQAERLCACCTAKGWKVVKVAKEVGSGVNEGRRKLLALLADPTVTVMVVEHKDCLTRFGFNSIETLLAPQGRSLEVVNVTQIPIADSIADCVSILYSFCARQNAATSSQASNRANRAGFERQSRTADTTTRR
jgi:putative resolvase